METIKVKINKISNAADTAMIGKTLQIDNEYHDDIYFRIPYEGHGWYVLKSDCEIVTDTITVTADKIRAMAAKSPQVKEVLKEGFPECFEEDKYFDLHLNGQGLSLWHNKTECLLTLAEGSAPEGLWGKCLCLSSRYNFELIENRGIQILIPTKK